MVKFDEYVFKGGWNHQLDGSSWLMALMQGWTLRKYDQEVQFCLGIFQDVLLLKKTYVLNVYEGNQWSSLIPLPNQLVVESSSRLRVFFHEMWVVKFAKFSLGYPSIHDVCTLLGGSSHLVSG